MNALTSHTALLFFSRTASVEALHKQLLPKKRNLKITQELINSALHKAKNTGLPYFFIDETIQIGHSFGEKLSHGFETIFEKGFTNVIAIGNDCLQLDASLIKEADFLLQQHSTVIGPAKNGGIYLMGLNKNSFSKELFLNIRWQTPHVCNDFFGFADAGSVYQLPKLDDVNTRADLKKTVKALSAFHYLKKLFSSFLASLDVYFSTITVQIKCSRHLFSQELRGPPCI